MRALSAAAAIAAFLLLAGCHPNLTTAPGERVWEGEITVSRGEEVKEGERLVIRPGTRVIFPQDSPVLHRRRPRMADEMADDHREVLLCERARRGAANQLLRR